MCVMYSIMYTMHCRDIIYTILLTAHIKTAIRLGFFPVSGYPSGIARGGASSTRAPPLALTRTSDLADSYITQP